jgi:hypothetical protein
MNNTIKIFAVCVAAPVVALGVAAPAAWAGPNGPNVSVCHNGVTQVHKGGAIASCFAGNSAVATGAGSVAFAGFGGSTGNRAVATGGSTAFAGASGNTSNNTAIATNGSHAVAEAGTTAHAHNGQTVSTP